jgi:nicotinamidase-related amidase
MPELTHIDPRGAALLVMDYQVDALTRFMTAAQSADAIVRMPELIATARDAGMMVIHVVVAFRPGHPELSPRNRVFSLVKASGMLVAGSEGAAIHPADTLVLGGVHTSGVVLSTVCQAVDLDYRLVVVRDCCADPDAEAHAMLLDVVIPKQAAVVTTAELVGALSGRSS